MLSKRALFMASIWSLFFAAGCPAVNSKGPSAPTIAGSCTVEVDGQYVMTNPISINATPTLVAKSSGFAKSAKLSYVWMPFPKTATITGSGKSVTIDTHNVTGIRQMDVQLQVSASDGTGAVCDANVFVPPHA